MSFLTDAEMKEMTSELPRSRLVGAVQDWAKKNNKLIMPGIARADKGELVATIQENKIPVPRLEGGYYGRGLPIFEEIHKKGVQEVGKQAAAAAAAAAKARAREQARRRRAAEEETERIMMERGFINRRSREAARDAAEEGWETEGSGLYGGAEPIDKELYEKAKAEVYPRFKKASAYRSGALIKRYKEMGGRFRNTPGGKPLARWFKEEWKDIGNKSYPVYRPTKRVSKDTPLTPGEIDPENLQLQISEKQKIRGRKNLKPFKMKGGMNGGPANPNPNSGAFFRRGDNPNFDSDQESDLDTPRATGEEFDILMPYKDNMFAWHNYIELSLENGDFVAGDPAHQAALMQLQQAIDAYEDMARDVVANRQIYRQAQAGEAGEAGEAEEEEPAPPANPSGAGSGKNEYLKKAKQFAKKAGYKDWNNLKFANDGIHKLELNGVKFGRIGYGDFIEYGMKDGAKEAQKHRKAYLARARKMPGKWRDDPMSKNNLAIRVLWGGGEKKPENNREREQMGRDFVREMDPEGARARHAVNVWNDRIRDNLDREHEAIMNAYATNEPLTRWMPNPLSPGNPVPINLVELYLVPENERYHYLYRIWDSYKEADDMNAGPDFDEEDDDDYGGYDDEDDADAAPIGVGAGVSPFFHLRGGAKNPALPPNTELVSKKESPIVEEIIEEPMDDTDIRAYYPNAKIMRYSDLKNYKTILQLLPKDKSYAFLLYQHSPNEGHWVLIMRYGNTIEFFCSYGSEIDAPLKWTNPKDRQMLGEAVPYLSNLLRAQKDFNVIHNPVAYQAKGNDKATCGAHDVMRLSQMLNHGQDLTDYYDYMTRIKKESGLSYDEIVANFVSKR